MNLFEIATRNKYRFPYKGMISVEDLWDLNLTALDSIYKTLNADKKKNAEESLLNAATDEDTELNNKIDIIKYIVDIKMKERTEAEKAASNAALKQKLLAIKAQRDDEALTKMSDEELAKAIAEL